MKYSKIFMDFILGYHCLFNIKISSPYKAVAFIIISMQFYTTSSSGMSDRVAFWPAASIRDGGCQPRRWCRRSERCSRQSSMHSMQPNLFPYNNKQNFTQAAHLSFLVWVCSLHFALRVAGFLINIVRYTNEIFDGEPEYFGLCENMNVYQEFIQK